MPVAAASPAPTHVVPTGTAVLARAQVDGRRDRAGRLDRGVARALGARA